MKKVLLILLIVIVLLIGAAAAIPFLFKDEIEAKLKQSLNDNLTAKVDFKDYDLSIFRSFPDLSIVLDSLMIEGTDSFAYDTLANIPRTYLNLDIMSVIQGGTINIKSIKLDQPRIYAKVLKSGRTNWDITKSDSAAGPDTGSTAFKVALKKYEISDGRIVYDDESLGFYMSMDNVDHTGKGDFTQDLFTLATSSDIEKVTMRYGNVAYLKDVTAKMDVPVQMDMVNSKYTFEETSINLNNLLFKLSGFISMPEEDIDMDLKFDAAQSDFKNFLSLIPAIYKNSFDDLTASGKFSFNGFVKGTYNEKSLPAFQVNLSIKDGMFKYPSLPGTVKNVQLTSTISNPDGQPDHTVINVPSLHVEMNNNPFDAKLLLKTPVSNPDIDAELKGTIDLGSITQIVPLENTKLSGIIQADVKAKGRMSSIDQGKYEDFNASGQMNISNLSYSSPDMPEGLAISTMKLIFNPENVTVEGLNAKIGKSDFKAKGSFDNYLAYFLKDGALKANLDLSSNVVDVNELMGPDDPQATADTVPMAVIEVPGNLDFTLSSNLKRVLYEDMLLENVQGTIIIKDQTLFFNGVRLNTLDGLVTMNGSYNSLNRNKPVVNMDFAVQNLDIQQTYNTFTAVKAMAPLAKYTSGNFSANIKFASDLDKNMNPFLNSVTGEGGLDVIKAIVSGFEPLNKINDALKTDKYKQLQIDNTKISFIFSNGRVIVKPFDVNAGKLVMNVAGSNGFDQTLDYTVKMNMPRTELGAQGNSAISTLAGKAGAAVQLPEKISISALVGGTVLKPTVKLSLAETTGAVKDAVKTAVKDAVDEKRKELEDKARAETDRLKAEAEAKKKEAEAKARAEAERLKKEAENRAKEEAKKKLKKLFP